MDAQVIEAQPDSDADALAAFERMNGQLAMLTAAVEGFAARQARIEQRDYSQDLAQLAERQDKVETALRTLASRPGVQLTPDSFAAEIGKAAMTLRAPDQAALASAQKTMGDARSAMAAVVIGARTKREQRDAVVWAAVVSMGLTALLLALAPLLVNALWPAAAEDRAAAILHKSRWEAGIELMASGGPGALAAARGCRQLPARHGTDGGEMPEPGQLGRAAGALFDRDRTDRKSFRARATPLARRQSSDVENALNSRPSRCSGLKPKAVVRSCGACWY